MPAPRTDTPPVSTSTQLITSDGRPTTYFKRWLDVIWTRTGGFRDVSATVVDLDTTVTSIDSAVDALPTDSDVIAAGPAQSYVRVSNDGGATWLTTSPQTLTLSFYDLNGNSVASRQIIGTWDDGTGFITMTSGTTTGLTTTVSYSAGNGSEQVVTATVSVNGRYTSATFLSQIDTTALGGYSGGGGPSK